VNTGCSPTRRVPKDNFLLTDIDIKTDNKKISKDELMGVIKQKPNRKILGLFRFHLHVHNLVDPETALKEKTRKIQKRIQKNIRREEKGRKPKSLEFQTFPREFLLNIGEPPVLLDTLQAQASAKQISLYLYKKGYFNNQVKDSVILRKKKAEVLFSIESSTPYVLNQINYAVNDPKLDHLIKSEGEKASLLKSGEIYDEENLIKERDRITKLLRNAGYYNFIKEFIHFVKDTTQGNHSVNIDVEVRNPQKKTEDSTGMSVREQMHKQFIINNVYVSTDYNPRTSNVAYTDTLEYEGYKFVHNRNLRYNPSVLAQRIYFQKGEIFKLRDQEETYNKLSDLRSFRFVIIRFTEVSQHQDHVLLDCHIMLSPLTQRSLDYSQEGTHRGGNLGVAGNIAYRENNPFKGAENIEFRIRGGFEAQQFDRSVSSENENLFFFNTKEIGPELTLTIPKFLLPVRPSKVSKYFSPKTTINASYNFQERPELFRSLWNVAYGYTWKVSTTQTHYVYPAELNIVNIDPKRSLNEFFARINNPFIERSFTPHATLGSRYVFMYSNATNRTNKDFTVFRSSFEGAGNALRGVFSVMEKFGGPQRNELGSYEIAPNTPFAQYVKADIDLRLYKHLNNKSTLVIRTFAGAGKPLNNLNVLPLEKSYFSGGSNSIRAWAARSLGPGSFTDTTSFNTLRIGDMSLEGNIEFRFDLYKLVEGAFFIDAGNIWLFNQDPARPGGSFDPTRVLDQLAVGTGFGLRLDFSFVILRLDLGIKARDPMVTGRDKWVIRHIFDDEWKYNNPYLRGPGGYFTNINFGIGYPF
jgi:outer membrane protein assembly factor BamA